MKYVYLANNRLGYRVLNWLVERGDSPAGLVVHPPERSALREDMLAASGLPADKVLEAPLLRTREGLAWLLALAPDWLVSVLFGYILSPNALAIPRYGAINLHPALLPYNRGAYPNVWTIVDKTPAGVTLHFIEAGIDAGDIITQREVPVSLADTGASLYTKLEQAAFDLFTESWALILSGNPPRRPQMGAGTTHKVGDVAIIDRIEPDQIMRAVDLIDILRARTFPPHKGAYLELGGHKVYLYLSLTENPE